MKRGRQDLDDRRAEERGAPRDRFVQDGRGGEEVGAGVHLVAQDLLRCHVARGAHEEPGSRELHSALEGLRELPRKGPRQAKVEQLDAVGGQEDVRRLEIAVDHPGRVQRTQGREHGAAQGERLRDRQRPPAEPVRQGLALEQLHRDEELPLVLADLVHLADVRVIDPGRRAGLPAEPPAGRLVGLGDRLDRDPAPQALVLGREDDPHSALPESVQDAVASEPPGRVRGGRSGRLAAQALEQAAQHALARGSAERRSPRPEFVVLFHSRGDCPASIPATWPAGRALPGARRSGRAAATTAPSGGGSRGPSAAASRRTG